VNREILNVAVEEGVDREAVDQLRSGISLFGDEAEIHEIPKSGAQASILLYGFTSIALVFGAAFVKKLGDKAAEDCYPYLKHALLGVYEKYFGENAKYCVQVISTSEKKSPDTKYSLVLALYCVGQSNERVKFLYETGWDKGQFDEATQVYIEAMVEFVNDDVGSSSVSKLVSSKSSRMQPYLVAWDSEEKTLVSVNPIPSDANI